MAVKKGNVRLWITIPQDVRKTIDLLQKLPLLKNKSLGEIVELAITSYALAIIEYSANKLDKEIEKENN